MPLIHNRGRLHGDKYVPRRIQYPAEFDAKGRGITEDENGARIKPEILEPGKHKKITPAQYEFLKKMFPAELVNLDDHKELQDQFKDAPEKKIMAGYLSPEEVEAEKKKAVDAALAATGVKPDAPARAAGVAAQGTDSKVAPQNETRDELIARIDAMDRSDLVAYIETNELQIDTKSKRIETLKAEVFELLEKNLKAA